MAKLIIPIGSFDSGCCRICIFLFNICFCSFGLFVIGLGVWMLISLSKLGILKLDFIFNLPWLAVTFGFVVLACSCASYLLLKKSILLFLYGSCLFILFVFGVTLGTLLFLFNSRIKESVCKSITDHMETYLSSPKDTVIDRLQTELECCGNLEPNDWLKTSVGQIPPSCCKMKLCDPTKIEEIYDTGCYPKLMEYIKSYTNMLAIAVILGSVLPLLGCILAFSRAYQFVETTYQQVE